jgi:anthranilate synthase/aminodeoxychorismate synthase-like glutamine amidotransferase
MTTNGAGPRLAVIDNYDSFTYNLVQYLGELGVEPVVYRNDAVTVRELADYDGIVISPGPGAPEDAGVSTQAINELSGKTAILGVCLGHQCLAAAFGGRVVRNEPSHGKTSWIRHDNSGVLAGVSDPFEATRYHSLIVERSSIPEELVVTAWTADETVMGLRHVRHPTYGVQFHPESVLTKEGKKILSNFIRRSARGFGDRGGCS